MESLDLWDAVEEDYEIFPLPENPTMAQIKNHKERKMKKALLQNNSNQRK